MMIENRPKAVIFDYGGTILVESTYQDTAGAMGCIFSHLGISSEDEMRKLEDQYTTVQRDRRMEKHRTHIEYSWKSLIQHVFSLHLAGKLIDQSLEQKYWNTRYKMMPTLGIEELLKYLAAQGIRTSIVSNSSYSSTTLQNGLDANGLGSYFDFIISSADCGIRKPNRYMLDQAMEILDLEAGDIWYIGDSLDIDIPAARNVGFLPILYTGIGNAQPASIDCLRVQDWIEVIRIIERNAFYKKTERNINE